MNEEWKTILEASDYEVSNTGKIRNKKNKFNVSIPYLLGYDTDNTLSDLITKINHWADERNLKQADPKIQWIRVTEEVGEIRDVFLKPHDFADP